MRRNPIVVKFLLFIPRQLLRLFLTVWSTYVGRGIIKSLLSIIGTILLAWAWYIQTYQVQEKQDNIDDTKEKMQAFRQQSSDARVAQLSRIVIDKLEKDSISKVKVAVKIDECLQWNSSFAAGLGIYDKYVKRIPDSAKGLQSTEMLISNEEIIKNDSLEVKHAFTNLMNIRSRQDIFIRNNQQNFRFAYNGLIKLEDEEFKKTVSLFQLLYIIGIILITTEKVVFYILSEKEKSQQP